MTTTSNQSGNPSNITVQDWRREVAQAGRAAFRRGTKTNIFMDEVRNDKRNIYEYSSLSSRPGSASTDSNPLPAMLSQAAEPSTKVAQDVISPEAPASAPPSQGKKRSGTVTSAGTSTLTVSQVRSLSSKAELRAVVQPPPPSPSLWGSLQFRPLHGPRQQAKKASKQRLHPTLHPSVIDIGPSAESVIVESTDSGSYVAPCQGPESFFPLPDDILALRRTSSIASYDLPGPEYASPMASQASPVPSSLPLPDEIILEVIPPDSDPDQGQEEVDDAILEEEHNATFLHPKPVSFQFSETATKVAERGSSATNVDLITALAATLGEKGPRGRNTRKNGKYKVAAPRLNQLQLRAGDLGKMDPRTRRLALECLVMILKS